MIELLLVMAILVLISGVTVPFLFGAKTTAALEEEARQIRSILKTAQHKATTLEDRTPWGVYFDNLGSAPFYDIFSGTDHSTGTTTDRIYLDTGIVFQAPPSASSSEVVFAKRTGNPTNGTSTSIIIRDTILNVTKTIIISPIGRVTVQ